MQDISHLVSSSSVLTLEDGISGSSAMMKVSAILLLFLSVYQSHAQLSAVNRNEILRAHNHVRSLVSPSATDMRRLVNTSINVKDRN